MLRIDSSVEISRPIDQVFAYLSTPSNWTQWLEGFTESHQEGDGSLVVGSKISQTIKFLGRRFDLMSEVVDYRSGRTIGMRVVSGPFPMAWTHEIEPAGSGTRVTTRLEADPGTFFSIAGPVLRPLVQHHLDDDHNQLKAILEGRRLQEVEDHRGFPDSRSRAE